MSIKGFKDHKICIAFSELKGENLTDYICSVMTVTVGAGQKTCSRPICTHHMEHDLLESFQTCSQLVTNSTSTKILALLYSNEPTGRNSVMWCGKVLGPCFTPTVLIVLFDTPQSEHSHYSFCCSTKHQHFREKCLPLKVDLKLCKQKTKV